jgi:hypothetical protein
VGVVHRVLHVRHRWPEISLAEVCRGAEPLLTRLESRAAWPSRLADRERRGALVARLENFAHDYCHGVITGSQLQKVTQAVTAELEESMPGWQ